MQKKLNINSVAHAVLKLSFEDLHLFSRIATLGSLSAVARERNAPVSQISRALQRIEAAYNTRLLHRTTHALSLTPEGQFFLQHCQRIEDAQTLVETDLGTHSKDIRGVVRMSAGASFANHVLTPGLAALRQMQPNLAIDLRVDDRVIDMAREGIDIAIRAAMETSDLLVQRSLGVLRRGLYASPLYLEKHGVPKTVADLRRHELIFYSRHSHLNQWRFKEGGVVSILHPQGSLQTDSTETLITMTRADLGISRLANVVAVPLVQQGLLVPVLRKLSYEQAIPINAVMLSERHRLPKVRACIDYWVSWFAKLNSGI